MTEPTHLGASVKAWFDRHEYRMAGQLDELHFLLLDLFDYGLSNDDREKIASQLVTCHWAKVAVVYLHNRGETERPSVERIINGSMVMMRKERGQPIEPLFECRTCFDRGARIIERGSDRGGFVGTVEPCPDCRNLPHRKLKAGCYKVDHYPGESCLCGIGDD